MLGQGWLVGSASRFEDSGEQDEPSGQQGSQVFSESVGAAVVWVTGLSVLSLFLTCLAWSLGR